MKLQVLIADADPDFQRTMTQALSREGDMEAAGVSSDGLETLSLIQTARPDVVLLDLIQQRLDGLAILRRLAGREDAPPVLVLTGFVNAAIVAECARLGILFTIRDADPTAGITKVLYPTVAKKFSSTPSCVERSMRHAIDIAWNRGDEDVQEKIFCGAFSGSTGRPTNGEFIATIAELVLQQIGK